ncbi:sugar ABC transporter permease [Saccharopolyspora sp. K220]|uniref:carbohydrate ABC transporter permease n=1 Tax=Saccharopolyspora soli TaxID=2926618 RepID=UPI001F55DE02|nr:sugar ABC transporter permease [Saccharopolyspora soli]MCI2416144.1 sugar ABC transporter permease [Saccharopolyspora soli]
MAVQQLDQQQRRPAGIQRSRQRLGWLYLLPLLAVNLLVMVGPGVFSLYYSFTDYDGIGTAHWVGLDNYVRLLGDTEFIEALLHNLAWTLYFLLVPMAMGLLGAFLLSRVKRFQLLLRVLYFLPYIVATVVNAMIWRNLLAPDTGLGALTGINFLGDTNFVLPSIAVVNNWAWWGFLVVVFLAAMQSVSPVLYEAAELDGASKWRQFWHVTLPGIRPTFLFLGLMTIVWSFLIFDYVYILTDGGPAGSSEVLGTVLYRNAFTNQEVGYAAAIGVVMTLISAVVVLGYLYLRRKKGWEA